MADVPVATIDETGLHLPTYDEGLAYFQDGFRGIFGDDVNLEPSTQDGQFMALLALALQEANGSVAEAYNAFSPSTAQGIGLSRVVKINGLLRKEASYSTADLLIVGQAGSTLDNGAVTDEQGNRWRLPLSVVIPLSGQITVTATATTLGAIAAPANTITTFATQQRGFQSVTNPQAAVLGDPVERDPALKARQRISTSIPAQTVLEGLMGGVIALPGVVRARGYENDTNLPDDETGLPAHAIAIVVEGGDAEQVAALIAHKKAPGSGTYGSTRVVMQDAYGIPHAIAFFRPTLVPVAFYLKVRALRGYTSDIEGQIRQALADWVGDLGIGNGLPLTRAYLPANLNGAAASKAFEVLTMVATRDRLPPTTPSDLDVAFNERLFCSPADVNITVVTA